MHSSIKFQPQFKSPPKHWQHEIVLYLFFIFKQSLVVYAAKNYSTSNENGLQAAVSQMYRSIVLCNMLPIAKLLKCHCYYNGNNTVVKFLWRFNKKNQSSKTSWLNCKCKKLIASVQQPLNCDLSRCELQDVSSESNDAGMASVHQQWRHRGGGY